MKACKNEDEVEGNAVYETTRIHSQGDAVSNRTNANFFPPETLSSQPDETPGPITFRWGDKLGLKAN